MKLDGLIGPTVLDANPGTVGAAMDRVEGRLKVTGAARYANEVPIDAPLYGFIVQSTVASGSIAAVEAAAASTAPGVRLVLTYKDTPIQGAGEYRHAAPQMTDTTIRNWGNRSPWSLLTRSSGCAMQPAKFAPWLQATQWNIGGTPTSILQMARPSQWQCI